MRLPFLIPSLPGIPSWARVAQLMQDGLASSSQRMKKVSDSVLRFRTMKDRMTVQSQDGF